MHIFSGLLEWTINISTTPYADWGLFGISFAESSFFPIPPDILQIALSAINTDYAFKYAAISLAGSISGAALGYAIGRYGGRPVLNKFVSQQKIEIVENLFNKYDVWAIGIAGLTPIPYKLFTISGGAFKIRFWRFIGVSVLARGARFFLVASAFHFFGDQVKDIVLKNVNLVSIMLILALIGGYFALTLFRKAKK